VYIIILSFVHTYIYILLVSEGLYLFGHTHTHTRTHAHTLVRQNVFRAIPFGITPHDNPASTPTGGVHLRSVDGQVIYVLGIFFLYILTASAEPFRPFLTRPIRRHDAETMLCSGCYNAVTPNRRRPRTPRKIYEWYIYI